MCWHMLFWFYLQINQSGAGGKDHLLVAVFEFMHFIFKKI